VTEMVVGNFFMVIVACSLPVNIMVTSVLYKNRNHHSMNNVYFQIYLVGSIIDLIAMINNYVGSIFPSRGWFLGFYLDSTLTGKIFLIFAWSTRFGQEFTTFLISVNRASAIMLPLKYDRLWNQY
ncbi:hypothetical protein PFISCL1PPCAC_3672, partial [Pristionchus fissidentatus]